MLRPMIGKKAKHKRFEYNFRHYKPDPKKTGTGMKFKSLSRRGTGGSVFVYAILLFLVLWLIT